MAIRCGHHGTLVVYHDNVAAVRDCSQGQTVFASASSADNPPGPLEIEEGMYYLGDRIIKVQIAHHGSGHLYTKELVRTEVPDPTFDFVEGAYNTWEFRRLMGGMKLLRTSRDARKMTLEEAVQFGKLYGVCCRCGTVLTNEKSIKAGIGPYCAGKF